MKKQTWLRPAARGVALLWAGFWVFFGLASGIGEGLDWVGVLIHTAVPGLIFLALALLAWYREEIGGALLVIVGLVVLVWYPIDTADTFRLSTIVMVLLTMALPPLLAGGVCLACWRRTHVA